MRIDHASDLAQDFAQRGPVATCQLLNLRCERHGSRALICCPWHNDRTPSCSVAIGPHGSIRVHCFTCDQTWDVHSLVAQVEGLDVKREFLRLLLREAELLGRWDIVQSLEGRKVDRPMTPPPPPKPPPPPLRPEPTYPDPKQLAEFVGACVRVDEDREVSTLLRSRGLDPHDVAVRDLALALVSPPPSGLPSWARFRGMTWIGTGHRLIVPMYDHRGEPRSVRAWRVIDDDTPKRLPPSGHKAGGLVMLDAMGREAFRARGWPSFSSSPPRFVILEGEPDFLTWATQTPLYQTPAHACIGIPGSGSWTDDIASAIPNGATVIIRTHHDPAGDKYAGAIANDLKSRCRVLRGGQ